MENQTNIINPPPARTSWWSNVPKFWPIAGGFFAVTVFLFTTYFTFVAVRNDVSQLKEEIKEKVDKHDFKDLDDKVSRQWTTQNDNINRVRTEFNPVRDWVEWRKGYDQALKDMKK